MVEWQGLCLLYNTCSVGRVQEMKGICDLQRFWYAMYFRSDSLNHYHVKNAKRVNVATAQLSVADEESLNIMQTLYICCCGGLRTVLISNFRPLYFLVAFQSIIRTVIHLLLANYLKSFLLQFWKFLLIFCSTSTQRIS